MIKLMGSLLILAGGILIRQIRLMEYRRRLHTLADLASSLRRMSDEIRTLRRPLPELMQSLSGTCGPEAGTFFKEAAVRAEHGEDLSEVWRHLSGALPLSERDRAALEELGDDLRGYAAQLCGAAELASRALSKSRDELEEGRLAEEKRITALSLSAALLLVILLI